MGTDGFSAFVDAARRFCALIEGAPYRDRDDFAVRAARTLADVHAAALLLDGGFHHGPSSPSISHEDWTDRFDALGETLGDWSTYWSVFDMEGPEAGEAAEHFLDDDLADVWRDLKAGLLGLDAGIAPEVVAWEWRLGHRIHWGRHAVEAIRALHVRRFE